MYSQYVCRVCNNSDSATLILNRKTVGKKAMVEEVRNIQRELLPNGLTVITEQMQHIRSASIGIWIKTGSRDEDAQWNGISHFVEHMVF